MEYRVIRSNIHITGISEREEIGNGVEAML